MSDFIIITKSDVSEDPNLATRGFGDALVETVARRVEPQLACIAANVETVIAAVGSSIGNFGLNTVEVSIAVDATGKFGIASAGVTTSFKLSFTRRAEVASK